MKRRRYSLTIILSAFLAFAFMVPSKTSDIFSKDAKILWMGLDFSNFKLIGEDTPPQEMKEKYIPGWNQLLLAEQEKYNVPRMLHRKGTKIPVDFSIVREKNKNLNGEDMISFKSADHKPLNREKVKGIINGYPKVESEQNIGLIFVMGSFSKTAEEGSMWITFFDLDTKEVLLTEQFVTAPGGIGFRNYWARTIYNAMMEVQEKKYKEWKKKYS